MDSVPETPTKRRKINGECMSGNTGFDSSDDSGDQLFDDYETIQTLPLSRPLYENHFATGLTPSPPPCYVTQPTQLLGQGVSAAEEINDPSVVQVAASSPPAKPGFPHQPTMATRLGGDLATHMAPPGTAFKPPLPLSKSKPVVDISSDDDDHIRVNSTVSSDEESQPQRTADIKPSIFTSSAQTNAGSTNKDRFKEITTSSFYRPLQSSPAVKRSADVMADAYGNASRAPKVRKEPPTGAQLKEDITLDDIGDFQIRTKAEKIQAILPTRTLRDIRAALLKKKGNFDDAMDYLVELENISPSIDLTLSDVEDKATRQQPKSVKPTAKQRLKAPAKSIQSKWTAKQSFGRPKEPPSSPSLETSIAKPRRRLVQGRRQVPSPRATVSRKSSPIASPKPTPFDIDTPSDSAIESGPDNEELESKVLLFLTSCTSAQLADLAGITESIASSFLSHRPFKGLDVARKISGAAKTSTSSKRTSKRPVGDRIVDTCLEMWKGYDAIDGLVRHCETIGKPVAEQIKKWGADVYGITNDGELDLINFDPRSENGTVRDSGIGTPASTIVSADEDENPTAVGVKKDRNTVFGQPRMLGNDVILKDYQIVGVNWLALLFEEKLSCILADDMGLGKTCQVIAFLAHLYEKGDKGPHLVIVPGSTIENWLREFRVFCPKLSVMPYYAGQAERVTLQHQIEQNMENINVIVTTYGVAKTKDDCKFLRRLPLQVCVYDEGHILKNRKSAAYEQLTRFKSAFRLLLTGTPLQNNLSELVSLLAFIMPQVFREHSEDFDIIFSQRAKTSNDSHAALLSAQRINRARSMMAPFVLRRKKHQVLKYLPQKTRRVEYCELSQAQAELYNSEKARGLQVIADRAAGKKVGNETANVMMALRKASIHPLLFRRVYDDATLKQMARDCLKEDEFRNSEFALCLEDMSVMMDFELQRFCQRYPSTMLKYRLRNEEWMDSGKVSKLAELLAKYKENGDRVLVFSQFVMVMDILEDVMETLSMRFFRLDGQTKIDERQDMIDQFYADKDITVFLLSTKAGGAGINLACANKVIIFDSSFNPQDDIQAENRAHRVGQTREVEVVRLVTRGTIEEQIHALGQTKLALDDRVAGEGEGAGEARTEAQEDKHAEKQGQRAVEEMMVQTMKEEQGAVGK